MKRDTLFRLILAITVAVAVAVIGFFMRPDLFGREESFKFGIIGVRPGGEPVPQIGGQIVYAEGGVEFRNKTGLWQRATEGADLEEGYAVETLGDGRAIIALDDGSILRLNAHTQIVLESTDPHSMSVKLIGGEVYARVVAAERTFEVAAGEVIYESLGTAYTTVYEENAEGVKVFHSRVKVKGPDGNEIAVVDEGEKFFTKDEADPAVEGKISDIGNEEIGEDDFVKWNAGEDLKYFETEMGILALAGMSAQTSEEEEALSGRVEAISLSYDRNGKVSWSVSGISPLGFKLIWSKNLGPSYPTGDGDMFKYYDDPGARAGSIYAFDGAGTYYIRVCEYLGGVCGIYSNEAAATFLEESEVAPPKDDSESSKAPSVSSLSLSGSGPQVAWSVSGTSSQGFKLVWSKASGPTYPTRTGDQFEYYSDPGTRSGTISAFDGSGTYHVRVCEYLGGRCGTYSNEIVVDLGSSGSDDGSAGSSSEGVSAISLATAGGEAVTWTVDGYSSMGFKVVWSKNAGPTYPLRSGDKYVYLAEPGDSYVELFAFSGSGTYHVRVCEYLGGRCGTYSNEVTMEL